MAAYHEQQQQMNILPHPPAQFQQQQELPVHNHHQHLPQPSFKQLDQRPRHTHHYHDSNVVDVENVPQPSPRALELHDSDLGNRQPKPEVQAKCVSVSTPDANAPKIKTVRNYKLFPGRNRFFCSGRIVMAKQISVFYFTLTILTCTCVMFFVFE